MRTLIRIILGIAVATMGGRLGLRRLLIVAVAAIAGWLSIVVLQSFHGDMYEFLSRSIRPDAAFVWAGLVLLFGPSLTVLYLGRKALVLLHFTENLAETIDQVMGAGFAVTIYIAFLVVLDSLKEG